MLDPKILDDLSAKIAGAMPPQAKALKDEFERTVRLILERILGRLNLVTREEFDIQAQVLARTRAKLETLEAQIGALEERLAGK